MLRMHLSAAYSSSRRSRFSFGVIPRFSFSWQDNPSAVRKSGYIIKPSSISDVGVVEASNTGSPIRATTKRYPQDPRTSFALYDTYDAPQA